MIVRRRRTFVAALVVPLAVAALAGAAFAHVSVDPSAARKGGFTKLSFRVPNERDDATTVKVEVAFPIDHPLASVSVRPIPGWTSSVERTKLDKPIQSDDGEVTDAVSRVIWQGGAIKSGEFEEFDVSVGPLPTDVDSLEFKALQTYSDGQVVRWIESATGGTEPEHPAPVLTLTAAGSDDHGSGATTATTAPSGSAAAASKTAGDDDGATKTLAIAGLVLGALGLAAGVAALASARRRT